MANSSKKKKVRGARQARAKTAKQATRKAGKSSSQRKAGKARPAGKKTGKVRKQAAVKKTRPSAKPAAVKQTRPARKKAAGKKAAGKTTGKRPTANRGKQQSATGRESKDAVLVLDDLAQIDALVADARPGAEAKTSGAHRPQTPTTPRSVKPPPKSANLEMSAEILEFVDAINAYRQENSRPFPTWTEVFSILKRLGYTKS